MTIILDFDYTLLDTARIKTAIKTGLAELGVDERTFLSTWEQATLRPDGVRNYDPDVHARLVSETGACTVADASRVIDQAASRVPGFLFPGVETVLRRLRSEGWTLALMTRGVVSWQKLKFARSGLQELFSKTFFLLGPKTELVEPVKALDAPVIMVNDDGQEIDALRPLLPDVRMIAVRGPRPLPSDPEVPVCGDMESVYKAVIAG
jgi:phosphoglycolate phosphatase-like HAD superfamily hydrolase